MVNYRLKNLIESGVIQAFRVGIDLSQLGLKHFKADIHLREHTQRKYIMNYIKYHPNLTFIAASAGVSDLELEFDLEDAEKLHQIMEEINTKFSGAVRKYDYFSAAKIHKVRNMPEV
jgi:DNA-binding Lrp family transcriptional regulator